MDTPINSMDCIRINTKFQELEIKPEGDPTIYTYRHLCTINVIEKKVEMDNGKILDLLRGDDYERPRGD